MIAYVAYVIYPPILLIFVLDPIYGLNELPEVHCEFAVNLIGMSTMAILTGQSWDVLKS